MPGRLSGVEARVSWAAAGTTRLMLRGAATRTARPGESFIGWTITLLSCAARQQMRPFAAQAAQAGGASNSLAQVAFMVFVHSA